ncbi:MAG TPA: ABC transporter permease [Rhodocyclaceae bacterium]|nr:ABC transporter permease [Rhodocyclaceae bacterium]
MTQTGPLARSVGLTRAEQDGAVVARLSGTWTLAVVGQEIDALQIALAALAASADMRWDCSGIDAFDSTGAMLLWRAWGRKLPASVQLQAEHQRIFARLAATDAAAQEATETTTFAWLRRTGALVLDLKAHLIDFVALLGQFALNFAYLCRYPAELPRREISANLFKAGVRAMPVTALVGWLIGIVLSYLSSLQLRQFGADVFIINILGLGIIRELGPLLVAILIAGRTGSAMTAQLGVMRVTEEIDALNVMGVQRSLRLVFPKVVALALAMPMLVVWTTAAALVGGMLAAQIQLDISAAFFFQTLPKVVPIGNVWIALAKGVVFGLAVALVACHFGLRVRPNTESLSSNTTSSVVTAITVVILLDAIFAIATRNVGLI